MISKITPVHLSADRLDQAADLLMKAFMTSVVYTYIFPDPEERMRSLRRYFRAYLRFNLLVGEVYTTEDLHEVACWLSPENLLRSIWGMVRSGFATSRTLKYYDNETKKRLFSVVRYTEGIKKIVVKQPFWYLALLGVDPVCQRQGIGGQLLQPVLAKTDWEGLPVYLETDTEDNVRFYERQNFKVVNEGWVPGADFKIWAMARKPTLLPG